VKRCEFITLLGAADELIDKERISFSGDAMATGAAKLINL
jgi:hypothetical protein